MARPMKKSLAPLVCVAVFAVLLLAAPAAVAATFTVNSTADAADTDTGDGICDASGDAGLQCTFRAAAQQANVTGGADIINFDGSVTGQTISIATSVVITQTVTIDGCSSQPAAVNPCVGIDAAPTPSRTFAALSMGDGPDSTVRGLAITGADQGIFNGFFAPRLTLRNNWFGLRIDGTTVDRNNIGVTLTGSGSVVGGTARADRNVFVGNNDGFGNGISVNGSSDIVIRGNYIGMRPDGTTPAGLGSGISSEGIAANPERLTIGGRVSVAAQGTAACDDACNLISANGTGIDLGGSSSNTKETKTATIAGNYIGLTAGGEAVPAPAGVNLGFGGPGGVGVDVHHADNVTIGGADFFGDRNLITADGTAISAWAGSQIQTLSVQNNYLGTNRAGSAPLGQLQGAAAWLDSNTAQPLYVASNLVAIGQVAGLDLEGRNATIASNLVGIGPVGEDLSVTSSTSSGIRIGGAEADATFGGNVITSNTIGNAGSTGVLIHGSDRNQLIGNTIGTILPAGSDEGNGSYGVALADAESSLTSELNVIGGNTTGQGNTISNNPDAAIAIFAGSGNRVGPASGTNNGTTEPAGGFIDLGGDGRGNAPTGPNEGVQAPEIVAAGTQTIFGTGTPGATIRVYSKDTNAPGELTGLRVVVTPVGDDGTWIGHYPTGSRPAEGQIVAATQTLPSESTSELSGPEATLPSTQDRTPPETSITGPSITNDATPAFSFGSTKTEGGYLCSLDGAPYKACDDPYGVGTPLSEGSHLIEAVAVDPDGFRDETPAQHQFTVDLTAPTAPELTAGPGGPTNDTTPTFGFSGEQGATFACSLDGAPVTCGEGFTPDAPLAEGTHAFSVQQTDAAGNTGPAATRTFTVDTTAPTPPVISRGPSVVTRDSTPTFAFTAAEPGRYACRFDADTEVACGPGPFTAAIPLPGGRHAFRVTVTDAAGNVSAPATGRFRVDLRAPQTRIVKPPPQLVRGAPTARIKLRFRSTEAGSRLQCRLDRRPWRACRSPRSFTLAAGRHVIRVRAIDQAGNRDRTPAKSVVIVR